MKKLIPLTFLCLSFLASHAQMGYGHVDFEDTATLYRIDIDTTLPGNLWQIGHPQKTLFTASYNPPNAIVTDTLNPVPANSTSVFYYRTSGDFNADSHDTGLYFWYMLDGDTLSDYGTIEFSVDYGATWRNVVKPDPYYGYPWWVLYDSTGNVLKSSYNSSDTIVFTGTTNGWYQFTIMDWLEMTVYDSIIFRFTYYTSATAAPHDGWMIDDIWFNTMWEFVPERGQSFIAYPNPATDRLTITPGMRATAWKITDMTGSVVLQGVSHESLVNIDVSGLKKGFYIYKLRLENGSERAGKFLKE